ncbi:tRNA ligase 1-like [Chenopodium quinoa]|uniref:tRNA ligase 1-like n=1 Tax=Chenopodium quinoa TaxID=63459 RepID=UPI000B791894|nr:tRNA ligase 1-like [Chenopodium quinoa]
MLQRLVLPSLSSTSRTFFFFLPYSPRFLSPLNNHHLLHLSACNSTMPRKKGRGVNHNKEEKWKVKSAPGGSSSSTLETEAVIDDFSGLNIPEQSGKTNAPISPIASVRHQSAMPGQKVLWKPKSYGTLSGVTTAPENEFANEFKAKEVESALSEKNNTSMNTLFSGKLLENFTVDSSTCSHAQIRATFYPKFENEKSDQEIRTRMIEMVSNGLATMEVSLKHSGSLFMYAGHEGGAYAKNSFGNIYTAVGVFVLGRMFREAWGSQASKKQAEFNDFLERNHMCISMELVTAVLGDHGQRPREDYVVVTAVTELGLGKPKFYSTPEIIAFCRKWRLPTNHVWLLSTRKSVTSFFAAFDALCEEGTATSVCKALDEVADISIPGTKDHTEVQGEILEGLVARIVSPDSSKHLHEVLSDCSPPPVEGAKLDLGPTLREICAKNRSDEKQQIRALLDEVGSSFCPSFVDWLGKEEGGDHSRNADRSVLTKFLQAHPADYSTRKLQEMIRLMREKRFPAAFKCYYNFHKADTISSDNIHFKMVIHVYSDSVFKRYQKEMRRNPGLWPLYRGFFVDIHLFKGSKHRASDNGEEMSDDNNVNISSDASEADSLADEDANLMVKLKFLTYKLRTFLIRNGLSILFKDGSAAYKAYYLRQMKIWGTSAAKQKELSKMLDEWAVYIRRKCGHKQLKSNVYLSEAESFLEQYAKRSPANQTLIGAAGNLVRSEDFLAIAGDMDDEGDLEREREIEPISPSPTKEAVRKEGLIVFFPGIPGCAKSALCRELLKDPSAFGEGRHVQSLMGDLTKGRYWQKVAEECKRKSDCIMLADKNAPNEEVWKQIEEMCRKSRASAIPVVPDSEGTDSYPFCLDALSVFMLRVLQRVNHPGNLDKASPNVGYVLLMFYHLYEGKSRKEFEAELIERFGSVVKMPLLKAERASLPDPVKSVLEEGINLYKLHTKRHGRMDSSKGSYAKDWANWERHMRETLLCNSEYLNSIQVPFESAVNSVLEQLKAIAKGDYITPSSEKRRLGAIVYAGVSLPVTEIRHLLSYIADYNSKVEPFFSDKNLEDTLRKAHVTLAHKRSHGVIAVANFGQFLNQKVDVELTALLISDNMAALEARIGSVDGEKIESKNEWPHVTLWTASGIAAKEASTLPQLVAQGKASRIEIDPPVVIVGEVDFF